MAKKINSSKSESNNVVAGRNFPAFVANDPNAVVAWTPSAPKSSKAFAVNGVEITVKEFEDDYTSFGNKPTAFKKTLTGYHQILGFLRGIADIMDYSEKGTFVNGLHTSRDWRSILSYFDTPVDRFGRKQALVYINWGDLLHPVFGSPAWVEKLAAFGVTPRGDEGNHWCAYSTKNNRLFRMFIVKPMDSNELKSALEVEQEYDVRESNEHHWNIQNKHDGMNIALALLAGDAKVCFNFQPDEKFAWQKEVVKKYISLLFATREERQLDRETGAAFAETRKNQGRIAFAVRNNPDFVPAEYVAESIKAGQVEIYRSGACVGVERSELIKNSVTFVYADGSPAGYGETVYLRDDADLTAAQTMALYKSAILSIVK